MVSNVLQQLKLLKYFKITTLGKVNFLNIFLKNVYQKSNRYYFISTTFPSI